VDLYGGSYSADSVQFLFSVTKAPTALAAAVAAEAGLLDLDAPISDYWPEMRKASTKAITPRMILSHRSGLASIDRELTLEALIAHVDEDEIGLQEPYWEPGTRHGYHGFTFGTLLNGVFRRSLGCSVGEYVDQEISKPLGLDLWIGLPEEQLPRVVPIKPPATLYRRPMSDRATHIPHFGPTGRIGPKPYYNDRAVLGADWPALSGVGSARALAAMMTATLDGRLLSADARDKMIATQSRGNDYVLGIEDHFGSGVMRPFPLLPFAGPGSYGHDGGGGCVAFADRELGIAVGWTTSVFPPMMGASPGFAALAGAIRVCLTGA